MADWFVYLVRCADGSLYTGITTDVARRINRHNAGDGAKYTRARRPVKLVYCESQPNRSAAAVRELAIRKLGKTGKEKLAAAPTE